MYNISTDSVQSKVETELILSNIYRSLFDVKIDTKSSNNKHQVELLCSTKQKKGERTLLREGHKSSWIGWRLFN